MRTFTVTGYDRETNQRRTIQIEAANQKVARTIAYYTLTYPVVGNETARAYLCGGPKPKERSDS